VQLSKNHNGLHLLLESMGLKHHLEKDAEPLHLPAVQCPAPKVSDF
jgi:hypothetical protein